jgi:hypothetical protein
MAILMLFSSMTVLFSCDKKEEENKINTNNEEKKYDEDSIFYERSLVSDELESIDYGGRKFRVVALYPSEVYIPEESRNQGNLMTDATFERNQRIENRFNVKIDLVYTGSYTEVADYANKTILAGSDEFDLLVGQVLETAISVPKNLYLNWYEIENIDFEKPWWFASTSEDLSYDDKCILAISHMNTSAVAGAYSIFFNKALATDYEMGDLYKLVLDGKWTYDKLHELVKDIYRDNGDDIRNDADFYGYAQSNSTSLNAYLWAFDNPICTKDGDGKPQISINSDKIDSIVSKVYDMCFNTNGIWCDTYAGGGQSTAIKLFYERRAIFTVQTLDSVTAEKMRNFEDDYGILPLPKMDENQQEYKSMVGGFHSVLAIPKTCKDTEFVGTMVEAISAESWKTITPTLYEIALKTRYLRDNESKETMDIIIDNVVFDFGYVYNIGLSYVLENMIRDGNSNFQSYFTKQRSTAKYRLKTVMRAFDKL